MERLRKGKSRSGNFQLPTAAEENLNDASIVVSYDDMETVTISPKFQVVIPQKVREAMGLRSGEKAKVFSFRNRIEIVPARDIRTLRGYLKGIDTSFVREGDRL